MNVNRKALNRKLVLKKRRADQENYDITLFELKTKWILGDVYVLLEHAQVSRELSLRAIASNLSQSLGKLALRPFNVGCHGFCLLLV